MTFRFLGVVFLFLFVKNSCQQSLESKIYTNFDGSPCVLMMDRFGQYGCRTSRSGAVGPLRLIETEEDFATFIGVPPADENILVMHASLLALPNCLEYLYKTEKVLGILLMESDTPPRSQPFSTNRLEKDPLTGFSWNPSANGLFFKQIPFPLWKLGVEDSKKMHEKALSNRKSEYPFYGAEITTFMHPGKDDNSISCMHRGTCKPLGGHSTWTSILPLVPKKEIVFAMASIDTKSLFQHQTVGANGAMSGTVALMGALEAIMSNPAMNVSTWKRQLVLAWFDGESFGNMGSRRFLSDINAFEGCMAIKGSVSACNGGNDKPYQNIVLANISSVVEAKQVGATTGLGFYVHTNDHTYTSPAAITALETGETLGIKVSKASVNTTGVPPSSVMSFFAVRPEFEKKSIVITDHAGSYENLFYDSVFDGPENVNADRVCDAASLLARTLYALSNDLDPAQAGPEFESLNANCSIVRNLLECLTLNNSCVKDIIPNMNDNQEFPIHYMSVFQDEKQLYQKLIHDWVFDHTSYYMGGTCNTNADCGAEENCVKGICQKSYTYYHDAVNQNLELVVDTLSSHWEVTDPTDPDPFWAESDWSPLGLRVFQISDPMYDWLFFVVAIIETIITFGLTFLVLRKFDQWFRISR